MAVISLVKSREKKSQKLCPFCSFLTQFTSDWRRQWLILHHLGCLITYCSKFLSSLPNFYWREFWLDKCIKHIGFNCYDFKSTINYEVYSLAEISSTLDYLFMGLATHNVDVTEKQCHLKWTWTTSGICLASNINKYERSSKVIVLARIHSLEYICLRPNSSCSCEF